MMLNSITLAAEFCHSLYNSEPNSEPDSESSAPVLKNILKKRDEQDNFNEMS